jgi:Ribosomal protein L30E
MDVERGIRVAVDTGNVTLGSSKTIQALKLGKGNWSSSQKIAQKR